ERLAVTPGVRLTNYGEFLERHPPDWEVEVHEDSSWRGDGAGRPGWGQAWRGPLRRALDELRDALAPCFERHAAPLVRDPWAARDDYIAVLLDRAPESVRAFLQRHAARELTAAERVAVFKLLELQRHALLMFTSCGWHFDEVSRLEGVQLLQYAGRAV